MQHNNVALLHGSNTLDISVNLTKVIKNQHISVVNVSSWSEYARFILWALLEPDNDLTKSDLKEAHGIYPYSSFISLFLHIVSSYLNLSRLVRFLKQLKKNHCCRRGESGTTKDAPLRLWPALRKTAIACPQPKIPLGFLQHNKDSLSAIPFRF